MKKLKIFHLKIIIFTAVKYCCILHGRVCVMISALAGLKCHMVGGCHGLAYFRALSVYYEIQ